MCHCVTISRVSTPILIMFIPHLGYCSMTDSSVVVGVCDECYELQLTHTHTHTKHSCLTCTKLLELMSMTNFTAKKSFRSWGEFPLWLPAGQKDQYTLSKRCSCQSSVIFTHTNTYAHKLTQITRCCHDYNLCIKKLI